MFRGIKKLVCMAGIIIFSLGLASCAIIDASNTIEALELSEEEEESSDGLVVVGFSQPGAESAWRVALTESVKASFTEKNGYKLIFKDAQSKQDNQIKDIRTFIQQGVDYIILSPIVETGWDSVLEEAKEAGIPVIICDRMVDVEDQTLYTAYVGSDFNAEGELAINYIENNLYNSWLIEEKNGEEEDTEEEAEEETLDEESSEATKESFDDGKYHIVHIQGTIGSSAQVGRTGALEKALENNDDWELIGQTCGDFTKAKSKEAMETILDSIDYRAIDLIYCENDEEALGVISALDERGIDYGTNEKIKIICFDGTAAGLTECLNGNISFVVECNPLQGPYLLEIMDKLTSGKDVYKKSYVDETSFTAEMLSTEIIESRPY